MRPRLRPLTPGWVAAGVRARHMLVRRAGRETAAALASSASLELALERGWRVLSHRPRSELAMLSAGALDARHRRDAG